MDPACDQSPPPAAMKRMFGRLFTGFAGWLALVVAGTVAVAAPAVRVDLDPFTRRSIGGVSELRRETYFGLCDPGTAFDRRTRTPERYDTLIRENGVTFGRRLGIVHYLASSVREDPERPGFADLADLREKLRRRVTEPGERFRRDVGGRLEVAAHENHNAFPAFVGTYVTPAAGRESKPDRLPGNIAAAAELTAAVLRDGFTDFDRPRFFEPINEPHWSYWKDPYLAEWHLATRDAVRREAPGVLVGGPCLSVAYFYRNQYAAFDGLRQFIDRTGGGLDFYSFHCYDFLRERNGEFGGRITSGLPLESVLDLVQSYTVRQLGREVGLVVSEHGGYGAPELVERLAREHFPGEGFAWEMRKRSIDDFNLVSSVIANTLVFMDHPHTVWKAVPFILLEATAWDPTYYAVLYVPRDYAPKGEWLPTKKILFHRLFREVRGHRVAASCPDPDIQVRALADEHTLFTILHNLSAVPKTVELAGPAPAASTIRRFGRNADATPYFSEGPFEGSGRWELRPREAVVIIATYPQALVPGRTVDETTVYSRRLAEAVPPGGAEFPVVVNEPGRVRVASLRIGISRPADAGREITVTFNGRRLTVPEEASAPRWVDAEYATCKLIPLDPAELRETNTVGVTFADGRSGAVGAVALRVGREVAVARGR